MVQLNRSTDFGKFGHSKVVVGASEAGNLPRGGYSESGAVTWQGITVSAFELAMGPDVHKL